MTTDRPTRFQTDGHDLARLVAIVLVAIFALLTIGIVIDRWDDDAEFAYRDFHNFYGAGARVLAGEPMYTRDPIPFLLTPLSAPFVALLACAPERVAYALAAIVTAALFVVAVTVVARTSRAEVRAQVTACLLACTMPSLWFALYLGQLTGLYVALMATSFGLLVVPKSEGRTRGTEALAGVLCAILFIKPQLALGVLLVALLKRAWTTLAVFAVVLVVLAGVSVSLVGVDAVFAWREQVAWWTDALENAEVTWWRQYTLYAFLRSVTFHAGLSMTFARGLYAVVAGTLGLLTLVAVRKALARGERLLALRAVSMLVIASVALNAYLFYYDAAFLVVPWMIAFLAPSTYARRARIVIMALALAMWVLALTTPIFQRGGAPLPGLVAAIWLLIEILDLHFGKRAEAVVTSAR